jgi:cytochrome oxidase Cu insertion factor (SCO1/SenC/PrrC family)
MNERSVHQRGAHDRLQGRLLIGLAVLFFAPLGLSFYLYYGHAAWRPGGRVNAGDLIDPPRPLPSLALPLQGSGETAPDFLRGKWSLLYAEHGPCAERCRGILYETRQVRLALDRDMDRVQRVFIADGDCCDFQTLHEQHPDLLAIRLSPAAAPLLELLPRGDAGSGANHGTGADHGSGAGDGAHAQRIYVIDPLGNVMMSYAPDAKPKGMLEDMKRLLRLSHIG